MVKLQQKTKKIQSKNIKTLAVSGLRKHTYKRNLKWKNKSKEHISRDISQGYYKIFAVQRRMLLMMIVSHEKRKRKLHLKVKMNTHLFFKFCNNQNIKVHQVVSSRTFEMLYYIICSLSRIVLAPIRVTYPPRTHILHL